MAWLESHGNLARHPKTRRLMRRMGWTLPTTLGNLHLLWYWALEYAPTGNLTKFDPEELTHGLDLGDATPEQFLEAMVEAGFIDKIANTLRIHDWPEYTAKSLRPRFRKDPARWHQVLRSYGLPVITRRKRSTSDFPRNSAPAPDQTAPTCAEREPMMVGNALRAVRRITPPSPAPQLEQQLEPPPQPAAVDIDVATSTEQQMANTRQIKAQIPRSLSLIPGFVEVWWPRLLDMYQRKGTPLDPNQRHELLSRLCMRPHSAVKLLKLCVEHSLTCKWEHLDNTA